MATRESYKKSRLSLYISWEPGSMVPREFAALAWSLTITGFAEDYQGSMKRAQCHFLFTLFRLFKGHRNKHNQSCVSSASSGQPQSSKWGCLQFWGHLHFWGRYIQLTYKISSPYMILRLSNVSFEKCTNWQTVKPEVAPVALAKNIVRDIEKIWYKQKLKFVCKFNVGVFEGLV